MWKLAPDTQPQQWPSLPIPAIVPISVKISGPQLLTGPKPPGSTRSWARTRQWGSAGEASLTSDFRESQERGRQDGQEEFRVLIQVLSLKSSVTWSRLVPFKVPHQKMRAKRKKK